MLLLEMFIYCIIASIVVKYICKVDWFTVIRLCVMSYIGWLVLCIMLV